MIRRGTALLLALAAVCAPNAQAQESVVTALQDIALKDIRYLPRTLKELGDAKGYVLFFQASDCAPSVSAMAEVVELEAKYHEKGIHFTTINIGGGDSIMDMAYLALTNGMTFPLLKDRDALTAKVLDITKLPAVALLDADYKPVLTGGPEVLGAALEAYTAGAPLPASVSPSGCDITPYTLPTPSEPITYSKHIAPFVNEHCAKCHNATGNAPIDLTNYKRVAGNAEMLAEVVGEERMPPWYAHPDYGTFRDTPHITAEQRVLFAQWVAAGKPEGNMDDVPPTPEFGDSEWRMTPDIVIDAKQFSAIPAKGYVPYQYIFLPWRAEEDTYVQGIEIKPSNPKVVHHANLIFVREGFNVDESQDFLTGHVPGGMPSELDGDRAWFIPKGAGLALQVHLVTTGKPEVNRMSVALRYPRETVNKVVHYFNLDGGRRFKIPANDRAWRLTDEDVLQDDATGLGLFAHMHLRGKDVQFLAHYPDGTTETLAALPNYNFDWQLTYRYIPDQKHFPKGTRIECIAHYDNSAFNPYNPAPDEEVVRGAQTVNEMLNGFFVYTKKDEKLNLRIDPNTGHALEKVAAVD